MEVGRQGAGTSGTRLPAAAEGGRGPMKGVSQNAGDSGSSGGEAAGARAVRLFEARLVCAPGPEGEGDAAPPCRWHLPPAPPRPPADSGPSSGRAATWSPGRRASLAGTRGPRSGSARRLTGLRSCAQGAFDFPCLFPRNKTAP